MRYEDQSQTGSSSGQSDGPSAHNDYDVIPAGAHAPATGDVITGMGTVSGSAGADSLGNGNAVVTAITGAGGTDTTLSAGHFEIAGEYGVLRIDVHGEYTYTRNAGSPEGVADVFTYTLADKSGAQDTAQLTIRIEGDTNSLANAQKIVPGADGVVTLPAGVELSDVHVVGRDLVIDMPDGTHMVIVDGAVFVPQLVLGGVEVPATNVAALLIDSEPQPAAGPPQSSGGNFEVPVAPLDPGVPLGDLIPPTELGYQPPEFVDVGIEEKKDEIPTITIQPDGQPASIAATDSVDEGALPARIGEPAGSHEASPDETTTGVILVDSPDGVATVVLTVDGNDYVIAGPGAVTAIPGVYGDLTITSVDLASGVIGYSYTLTDNTSGDSTHDDFLVTLTDTDGDVATATLTIDIIDDVPTARADADTLTPDTNHATGNVMTGADTTGGAAGADTQGADSAQVTGVTGYQGSTDSRGFGSGDNDMTVQGHYGSLTIHADGSYDYTKTPGTGGGGTEVFNYTLTDGDGDTSSSTLTITLPDAPVTIDIPVEGGETTTVYEQGLPTRNGGETAGSGEIADGIGNNDSDHSEYVTGTIGFTAADGLGSISISGTTLSGTYPQALAADATGQLTINSVSYDPNTGLGSISYTYHLLDNTSGDNTSVSFPVDIVDLDGDHSPSGSLVIDIVDDVPTAHADTDSVTEGATADGNVLTGLGGSDANATDGVADTPGADGYVAGGGVVGVRAAGGDTTTAVTTGTGLVINGLYGTLTLNADGSYSYHATSGAISADQVDTFVYTIKDGDGDLSTTTLTINVANVTLVADNDTVTVNEAALDTVTSGSDVAHGTVTGSNPGSTAETATGTLTVSGATGYTLVSSSTGSYGTLVLNANGSYTYTLTSPFDTSPDANNGTNTENGKDVFTYTATDANGNTVNGTITVNIVDDVPTAVLDTNSVSEGATLTVNAAAGVLVNDTFGADGKTVPGGGVVGVRAAGGDTTTAVTTGTGLVINGLYGTLTLNADGSYSYHATSGAISADQVDTFVYTIKDGDGDLSTTTLTINVANVTLVADNDTVTVNEAALDTVTSGSDVAHGTVTGSNPGSTAETATGTLTVSGATGYTLVSSSTGSYGTLVLNANGSYTYTLTSPFDTSPDANNGTNTENGKDVFTYTATDANGNTVNGTITVNIVDDVPTAVLDTNSVSEGATLTVNAAAGVLVNDTFGADGKTVPGGGVVGVRAAGGDTTTAVTTGTGLVINGLYGTLTLNADGSYSYHATSGAISADQVDTFVYTIKDGDGDLSTTTLTINVANVTLVADNDTVTVNEAALDTVTSGSDVAHGTVTGSNPGSTAETATGTLTVSGATGYTLVSSSTGSYGTLVLNANGSYTYTLTSPFDTSPDANNGTNTENGKDVFTYTATDANGNTVNGTITVNIVDDVPTAVLDTNSVSEGATLTVNAAAGVLVNDTFGADGKTVPGGGVVGVRAAGGDTTTAVTTGTGLVINGLYGTLTLNADGSYSYHATSGAISADQVDTFVYTIKDGDGDLSTTTLTINVANVTLVADNDTVTVNEAALDTVTSGSDVAHGTVTGSNPGSTAETATGTLTVSGATGYTLVSSSTGSYGTLVLNANGSYTYTLTSPFDTSPDANNGTNTENGKDVFTYTATDANGNTVNGTITVNIVDDVPTAAIGVGNLSVSIDESAGLQSDSNDVAGPLAIFSGVTNVGVDPDMGSAPIYAKSNSSVATDLVTSTGTVLGADGGTVAFGLTVVNGTDSGLNTTAGLDIFLYQVSSTLIVGRVGSAAGPAAFAIAIDATGAISMVEYLSIYHPTTSNPDDVQSITNTAIQATVTATDGDGDISTASANIGGLIHFQDSGPILTSASNINIQNSGDYAASGAFAYNLGADGAPTSNNVFTSVTGGATVNGTAVTNWTIGETSEDGNSAVYTFSFDYPNGSGTTAHETGTLTFNKLAGTYTVDLANPIQGFTTLETAKGSAFVGYQLNSTSTDNTSPVVAVTTIAAESAPGAHDGFYVQFTGIASGNGSHETTTNPFDNPAVVDGDTTAWTAGELFSESGSLQNSWVSVSNSSNGVGGDTVNGPDAINFNLYNSNPTGTTGGLPTTSSESMFLAFDGIGASEDMIVVLKLWSDSNHNGIIEASDAFTTKAILVQNSDIYKFDAAHLSATTTALAGSPYAAVAAAIAASNGSNNDGLVVIESNDYNSGGSTWQIVGAQIVNAADGISGTGIDLNSAVGVSGGSSGAESFADISDTGPLKITNIGFRTPSTTSQTANLTFDATIQDGDGDTIHQVLTATVTGSADSSTPIALSAAVTTVAPVALDTDHDGAISYLSASSGVTYDMNGDGHVEATAWVGGGDSILVRDANHDGTVTGASEFVFGHDGVTDMQALASQYGSVLDANDADFGQFMVWNDANSNGIVDSGELQSLVDAGITSIGLVSDGVVSVEEGGDVLVAGQSTYTYINDNGGTAEGKASDVAFVYEDSDSELEQRFAGAANSSGVVTAAVAAMGLAAGQAAAHADSHAADGLAVAPDAGGLGQSAAQPAAAADVVSANHSLLGSEHSVAANDDGDASVTPTVAATANIEHADLAGGAVDQAPAALLHGTDAPAAAPAAAATNVAPAIVAADASLAPAGVADNGVQHGGIIARVVAEAVEANHADNVEALLAKLPGGEAGHAALGALASPPAQGVPAWDSGHMGGFTHDALSIITSEAMVLHQDAVQAVVNG